MKAPLFQRRPFAVVIPQDYKDRLIADAKASGKHWGIYFSTSGAAQVERLNPRAEYTYLWTTEDVPPFHLRSDYLDHQCTHREYYAQFVGENERIIVRTRIGRERITKSRDEALNDIPLSEWDGLAMAYLMKDGALRSRLKASGDIPTLAVCVCILKEAAKQVKEQEESIQHD